MLTNKILTRQYKLPLVITLVMISLSLSTKYITKPLQFNTESSETLKGSEMKFYSVELGTHSGKSDLLIETQVFESSNLSNYISPIVLVSLVKIN